ncbi:unnamed protein product [Hymenolepis diminuta]|uniref:X-box-binding protein 1 n=1 Tax=Hymenolepis diminuta TaxID=6216 RepID=A0A564YI60_HYMDI|nr:unnamed protein product [Hymenolepis diminuta]
MSVVRCHFFDDCGSSVSTKASVRRRANLSHLSTVEKDARRKRLNRIAAQKARERNKVRNKQLEERVRFLEHENFQIRRSCDFYKSECEVKNKMIEKLRGEISKFEELQLGGYMQGKSIESAVLPQLKGLTTCIVILFCLLISVGTHITLPPITMTLVTSMLTASSLILVPKLLSLLLHLKKIPCRRKSIQLLIPFATMRILNLFLIS